MCVASHNRTGQDDNLLINLNVIYQLKLKFQSKNAVTAVKLGAKKSCCASPPEEEP